MCRHLNIMCRHLIIHFPILASALMCWHFKIMCRYFPQVWTLSSCVDTSTTCVDSSNPIFLLFKGVDTLIFRFESLFIVFRCQHFKHDVSTIHFQIQVCLQVLTLLSKNFNLCKTSSIFFNVFKLFIDHLTKISKTWKNFFKQIDL